VGGNVIGADAALALLIEQLQAVLHDALACFYPWGHGLSLTSECVAGHLTTYPPGDKTKLRQDGI
jgi:hypothetical protein